MDAPTVAVGAQLRTRAKAASSRPGAVASPPGPGSAGGREPTEADVRRWLTGLNRPDQLTDPILVELLTRAGRLQPGQAGLQLGRSVAGLLRETIESLRPAADAAWPERLPYLVLTTCYVAGLKHYQAAAKLGLSLRQLTRERTRAVRLVQTELATPRRLGAEGPDPCPAEPAGQARPYQFAPIPAILDFQARPAVLGQLGQLLAQDRFVHVHGQRGIGKTCLVAELALARKATTPVLWYRFRAGVNDDLASVAFELAEHLRTRGRPEPARRFDTLPAPDLTILGRLIVRELAGLPLLVVLDDFHLVQHGEAAVAGFVEDAICRLPDLRVIVIGRHAGTPESAATSFEIPPMSRLETGRLLTQVGIRPNPSLAAAICRWTGGVPQLIRLAATWVCSASDEQIARGLAAFSEFEAVQQFLLASISELIRSADREVLDAASVFRQHFSDEAVAYVAGLTAGVVRDTSRRLVTAHLATRSRGGDVAFFHASVREYFYQRLAPDRRTELHRRAARYYQQHDLADEARHHERAAAKTQGEAMKTKEKP